MTGSLFAEIKERLFSQTAKKETLRGGHERKWTKQDYFVILCAFNSLLFVWFQWYVECGLIKTLDKHWTHPASICSALHFRGLSIVTATTLQIFVGTVKGQARVWDQVLKLTEAPLQLSLSAAPPPCEIVLLNFS